jgi:hypothetical protein
MAAALVNMSAKGYVKLEQSRDLVIVTQIATKAPAALEPEEDVLAWNMFRGVDTFDFAQSTPRLAKCADSFRIALLNRGYFSQRLGLSMFAWAVSGIASAMVLFSSGHFGHGSGRGYGYLIFATVGSFVVAVRTLPGTLEKIECRLPGSTAPRRPWTAADARPFWFLAGSLAGLSILGLLSNLTSALILASFMAVNAIFYFALQGTTAAGREILAQLDDYKKFLSAAEADVVSRVGPSDRVPDSLDMKHAYAIAFHLDLGWGEQFVSSIAEVVECSQIFKKENDDGPVPSLTGR